MEWYETYVSLETAKLLKQADFDWKIYTGYIAYEGGHAFTTNFQTPYNFNGDTKDLFSNYGEYKEVLSKPTLAVAQRWFREEKNIAIDIKSNKQGYYDFMVHRINMVDYIFPSVLCVSACKFNTYEEALENGIQNALVPLLNYKITLE